MKKYCFYLLLLILSACSIFQQVHNKRFQRYSNTFVSTLQHDPALKWDSVVLDASFQLYVRQICRTRPAANYYQSNDPNLIAAVTRCNCEESKDEDPERLEIQYLFYSAKKRKFVYLTTIPPYIDRLPGGWRNTYDEPLFSIENFANINYFNTFFFGRIDKGYLQMTPVNSDYPYQINYTITADELIITFDKLLFHQKKMPAGLPGSDLGTSVKFYRKDKWQIGLDDQPMVRSLATQYNNFLENRTIYLLSKAKDPKHQPKEILFYFNDDYSGIPGQQWHWLHFEDFRIKTF